MQILGKKLWQKLEDMWRDAMGLDDPYILFISIMILIKLLQSINYSTNYYFSFSFKNKIFFVTFLNIQRFENS